MKIFRNILTLSLLMGMTACIKSEVAQVPDRTVLYRVADLKAQTKAGEVSFLGEFADPSDAAFSSVGFLHGQGVSETQAFYAGSYETISWNGSDRWAPSHTYYWPKGAQSYVNFVSWYDKNGTPDLSTLSETSLQWTRSIAADENIMVADEAWRCHANAATYHIDDASVVGVPTLFRHMLTRVAFVAKPAKLSNAGTSWTITVKNFTLKNVRYQGTLALINADPAATGTSAWTATDGTAPAWSASSATQTVSGESAVALTSLTPATVLPMRSFLPQGLGTMAINFDYTIRTSYSADNYIEETASSGDIRLNSFTSSVTEWGMNRKITYTITIDPEARVIEIDPTASDWSVQPTQTINIE